ncbi:MAG TPA: hypothetical protein VJ351_05070 [Streptosporangiaceae bacterium]|nr:hypothetical protein [Streptosporangiaceae bacterium]
MGAAALPAAAQTWQDTALTGGSVSPATFGGANLKATDGTKVITLTGTNVTWSLHGTVPSGVSLSGATISNTGTTSSTTSIVADATDGTGNAEALVIPVALSSGSIQLGSGTVRTVSVSALADSNVSGTVKFSATSSATPVNFAESNLPSGLSSGNPVLTYVGGTAAPGTYSGVVVTATDADGAVLHGTFTLTVDANSVSNYGDEVNRFGNGFDSYQQHQYAGAIIAGWTATQSDPATHFILNNGTHQGAFQFEYAPKGSGSGLCVSDPGGGWSSDPLRDGLILTSCNTGPWQQFIPQSNGTLKNVATGLYVNPNGTGAQLRGGASPTTWGGSSYTWKNYSSLPG